MFHRRNLYKIISLNCKFHTFSFVEKILTQLELIDYIFGGMCSGSFNCCVTFLVYFYCLISGNNDGVLLI